jgi:hypothetical protein
MQARIDPFVHVHERLASQRKVTANLNTNRCADLGLEHHLCDDVPNARADVQEDVTTQQTTCFDQLGHVISPALCSALPLTCLTSRLLIELKMLDTAACLSAAEITTHSNGKEITFLGRLQSFVGADAVFRSPDRMGTSAEH